MRIALLSDIHGNSIALDAVMADIEDMGGVNAVGHGPTESEEERTATIDSYSVYAALC